MFPVLRIAGLELPTFGLLCLLGLFIAVFIQRKEGERLGYDPRKVEELVLLSVLCAWVGSKGFYILQNLPERPTLGTIQTGGYVFYGGVIAGVPSAILLARRAGIPGGRLVDIITPGMALGLAIGRLGCLCAGCDYGRPAGGPHWWTLTFTYGPEVRPDLRLVPPELQGVPLYPAQALMALSLLVTFAVIHPLRKRLTPWPGAVLLLYLVVEPPMRFLIEIVRGDADRGFLGPLSTSQAIAAAMTPIGIAGLFWLTRRPGTAPRALAGPVAVDNPAPAR